MNSFFRGLTSFFRDAPHNQPTPLGGPWQTMGGNLIPPHDTFDNVFPYVNALAQRFATVVPYAVDANGERISPPPALTALYQPNRNMSGLEFLRAIATTLLTQSHCDILIWTRDADGIHPGGQVTAQNIAGYTILPQASRQYDSTRTAWYHRVTLALDGETKTLDFSRDETIALQYCSHPEDQTRGVSPAMTVQKWATVDDMIADYERGFFGNGAVPAGMVSIVAQDATDFTRTKTRMEEAFRGADKINGILYNMVPVDPVTRKPSDMSKITWTPFQQANSSLDLTALDDVVNRRLANAMGVPDIVRGLDTGQTYANAQMAERSFVENTLKPLCMTVWDKWQFELDRITGGLGYGLTFDLDLPAQTDVEQVQAQTRQTQVQTLIALVNAGATVSAAATALGLSEEFHRLTLTPSLEVATPVEPVKQTREHSFEQMFDRTRDVKKTAQKNAEQHARRFFLDVASLVMRASSDRDDELETLSVELANALFGDLMPLILKTAEREGITLAQAIAHLAQSDPDVADIVERLGGIHGVASVTVWDELPEAYRRAYTSRLAHVAKDAGKSAFSDIQKLLAQADELGWSTQETTDALTRYCGETRARLLARNELVNAQRLGSLYSAQALAEETGVNMKMVWNSSLDDTTCAYCRHMHGKSVPVGGVFQKVGETITVDGKPYRNTFLPKDTCDGHPNCRCYATYEVSD